MVNKTRLIVATSGIIAWLYFSNDALYAPKWFTYTVVNKQEPTKMNFTKFNGQLSIERTLLLRDTAGVLSERVVTWPSYQTAQIGKRIYIKHRDPNYHWIFPLLYFAVGLFFLVMLGLELLEVV